MTSPARDLNPAPQFVSSQLSVSPSAAASVSLTKASAAPAVSGSPISVPGPPNVSSSDVESTPPQISAPPSVSSAPSAASPHGLSSPPLIVQGLTPSPFATSEMTPAGSKHLSVGSSSYLLASPSKLSTPQVSAKSEPRLAPSVPPVSSSLESVAHKSVMPPTAPGSHTTSPPATVATSSSISSLQQMVHGSNASCFSDQSGVQPEKPGPPKLMGANSSSAGLVPPLMPISGPSSSTPPGSCLSPSASSMSVSVKPSIGSKPCEPAPTQYQTHASSAVDTGLSNASTAPPPPGEVNVPSLAAHESPTIQPLSTLPLLTTHASRTAPVSAPPALVSLPPAMGTSSGVVQSSHSEQHPTLTTTPPRALKQSSPKPEHHGDSEERKAFSKERNGKPEEHPPQLDSGTIRTPQKVEVTESHKTEICADKPFTDLPGKPLQTTVASDQKAKNMDFEKHHMQSIISDTCETDDSMVEQTPLRKSPQLHSTRIDHLSDEEGLDNSTCDTPSRMEISSVLEKTSLLTGDSSRIDDSSQFDTTSHAEGEPSFYTTRNSSFSVEDSRDDTMDSTREEETSEAEETKNSCQTAEESMLESPLNNTAEMEEPPADSSDVTNSQSFVQSQADQQGRDLKLMIIKISHYYKQ